MVLPAGEYLLSAGATLDALTSMKETPLILATERGHVPVRDFVCGRLHPCLGMMINRVMP